MEKGEGDEEKVAELGHEVVEVQFGCGVKLEKVLMLHVVADDQLAKVVKLSDVLLYVGPEQDYDYLVMEGKQNGVLHVGLEQDYDYLAKEGKQNGVLHVGPEQDFDRIEEAGKQNDVLDVGPAQDYDQLEEEGKLNGLLLEGPEQDDDLLSQEEKQNDVLHVVSGLGDDDILVEGRRNDEDGMNLLEEGKENVVQEVKIQWVYDFEFYVKQENDQEVMINLEQGGLNHDLEEEWLENVELQLVLDYDVDSLAMEGEGCQRQSDVEFDENLEVVELQHQNEEPVINILFNINHELKHVRCKF